MYGRSREIIQEQVVDYAQEGTQPLNINGIPIQGLGLSSRLQGTHSNEEKRISESIRFGDTQNGEKGKRGNRIGEVNRILENATYLVGGSQSSSRKTKESFSIEKKRIA